jgi:antitoxin (DNA-binding transcriptional repressor) of toxin-antitoxin stability system
MVITKTNTVGLKELRENMDAYIKRLDKGESFTVIRRSKPVFRLAPVVEDEDIGWETVVDFTKVRKGGVLAEDIILAIKKIDG